MGHLFLCDPLADSDKAVKILYANSLKEAVNIAKSALFTVNA